MRRSLVLSIDLCLVGAATILAFVVRDNFIISEARLWTALPYLGVTLGVAVVAILLFGLDRSVWRFSSLVDGLYIVGASAAIVITTVTLAFALNRLEGVPRSIPVIQCLLIMALLMAPRVFMRLRHARRPARMSQFSPARQQGIAQPSTLVVGMNRLTELYLQSAQELHPGGVQVAGILGRNDRHTGRMMLRLPVLGIPEQVAEVIQTLSVHGVAIDRIVVTLPWTGLTPAAQSALRDIESGRDIRVQYLAHDLGFAPRDGACGGASDFKSAAHEDEARFDEAPGDLEDALMVPREERAALKQRPYWAVKRCLDILGAVTLILLLAPIMAIAALMVLLDLGGPVLFWQQRPGLAGRPFRVYKLRTMRAAYDENGLLIPDAQRMSWIGQFLRRTRIDELPQLFQIVKGDMSFIGPRPLLPGDQPVGYAARLLIRPGLTGWAQVSGGRQLSMVDKAALDLWYVRHASLWLDIKILVRTAFMLLFGERARPEVIRDSWSDVRRQKQMDPAAAPHSSASIGRPGSEKTRQAA